MQHVRNSKKTLILAAVVSIMGLSFVSSSQTNAISLRDVIDTVTGNNQRVDQKQNTSQNR
jgi:cell shape-determining protein MreC